MVSTADEKLQPRDRAAMLGVNTIEIYVKIEFNSQRREMLLSVTSRANQQLTTPENTIPYHNAPCL